MTSIKNPWGEEMVRFLDGYFYSPEAFLLDEIVLADAEAGVIEAKSSAGSKWLLSPYQRGEEKTRWWRTSLVC